MLQKQGNVVNEQLMFPMKIDVIMGRPVSSTRVTRVHAW